MDDPVILTHVLTYYGFTTSRQRHTINTFGFDTIVTNYPVKMMSICVIYGIQFKPTTAT